jgi:phosphatidate cytidylyltransferase
VFSVLSTYELFKIGNNTPFKSTLLIPALLLNLALFLPMLLETVSSLLDKPLANITWIHAVALHLEKGLWAFVVMSVLFFTTLIFSKKSIQWVFKYTFSLSIFYIIIPLALVSYVMTGKDVETKSLLFIVLLPIYLNDSLAYLFGKFFGKNKLIPSVSPKKTWEGFVGGAIGAAVTMLVLIYFRNGGTTETYVLMAVVSLLVSLLATLGDLFESKLKRAAEVKDSGNILPGHGGILDRIDAMLFAVPVLYVFLTTIFI